MTGDVLGGGVLVAVTAALWAVYFLPQWVRKRQFSATEQNALRIQRTIRVLAESSEVPTEVRLEATAREAAAQERILRSEQAAQAAIRRQQISQAEAEATKAKRVAEAAAAEAAKVAKMNAARLARAAQAEAKTMAKPVSSTAPSTAVAHARRTRARRVRATVALALLAGVVVSVVGGISLATGASATALIVGLTLTVVSLLGLRVVAPRPSVQRVAQPAVVHAFELDEDVNTAAAVEAEVAEDRSWMPRPLPKPLYLSRSTQAVDALAAADAADRLRRAAALAQEAQRAAERAAEVPNIAPQRVAPVRQLADANRAEVTPVFDIATTAPRVERPRQAPRTAAGQFPDARRLRSMGVIDETELGTADLDGVLRRRRNVG
ncbi:hypothetical protein [Lysinibacter cavernae]|uniref:Large exoprotein n=1 Tax=Lysinibacter cavernae TaxID=1640652 RepID=A0A7X5R451_9MICO|nr:hypothetical protein [Lysinibacter cavernae]NIH55022.1 hypothetical protein [Lysinibacter cavernae]